MKKQLIIITGPTGVGKTTFVDQFAPHCDVEIINGDVGQMYAPLSIGTAKPDWEKSPVRHHLFDVMAAPVNFTVTQYRDRIATLITAILERNKLPVIVGGSGFYLLSLFFPPRAEKAEVLKSKSPKELWEQLNQIDTDRAQKIDQSDRYRLQRALAIWEQTKRKPSEYEPLFQPIASDVLILWLDRDRQELYQRINQRVLEMIDAGWQQEVEALDSKWESFLQMKKLIGYNDFFHYLNGEIDKAQLIATIQQKSRNYAKRQKTFWRGFKEKIHKALLKEPTDQKKRIEMHELNLTHEDVGGYIKQLKRTLCP